MLRETFIHMCIVVAFLFIGGTIFRKNPFFNSTSQKVLLGLSAGILGAFLMHFSIKLADNILLDLRQVAIILSGLYGGWIALALTALIIAASRIIFFGIGPSAIAAAITIFIITFLTGAVSSFKWTDAKKAIVMTIVSTIILTANFFYILTHYDREVDFYEKVLVFYVPLSLIGGLLAMYISNYITVSNRTHYNLKQQAQYDYLTGLQNVRQFNSILANYVVSDLDKRKECSLLFIDIDNFKKINDTYGHPAGDEILRGIGKVLMEVTSAEDKVFRNGGEEFSVLLPHSHSETAIQIAENIRKNVETCTFLMPGDVQEHITVSIGIAYSPGIKTPTELVAKADLALYKAKSSGKNRVCA
ncbi:GGDEF domain-containing protein [Mesobacillus harenae]|uniref:GGDEF domain-containing protein n=1 Tax=Mesobacillus harenae TaxID=2213203 RepID=UPI0015800527|nr:diguanylate cyclase [Mesobacillus harenae]